MRRKYYILNKNGEPMPVRGVQTWARWFEKSFGEDGRRVARETIGDCEVSTVFLGLDHNWGSGPPILWETMIFGGKHDQYQDRCSGSREQAQAMHDKAVKMVKEEKGTNELGRH